MEKKKLTVFQMIERAMLASLEEQKRHGTKYGSRGKTTVVNLSTFGLFIALGYTFSISGELFSVIFFYLCWLFLPIPSKWGSLTKRTVCPATPLKPLVFVAYRRNIDFKIVYSIAFILLNINNIT